MGRWIVLLSVMGLLGMSLGCHHTGGMCDCDPRTYACRTGPEGYAQTAAVASTPQAELIKAAPKAKEMPKGF